MRSTIRERLTSSAQDFCDFSRNFPLVKVPPDSRTARINVCDSKRTHSLIFSSSMIDPKVERSRVQPARNRSAADRATSPCQSSLDGRAGDPDPAILRFVESQANAGVREKKKKRGKDEIATRPRRRSAGGGGGWRRAGGATTGACCNQWNRVDCCPPDDRRDADRLHPVSRRTRNECSFGGKRPRVQPGSARPTDKRSNISDRPLSLSHVLSYPVLLLSLSLSFFLSFFSTLPSQSLCLSSRSICLYQGSPLADTALSRSLSISSLRLRLFLLSPFGEDMSCRNRASVPHPTFTKYTQTVFLFFFFRSP